MVPFVCGCRNLGEAFRRIREGAALIRTKGEAGTGNIVETVRHVRTLMGEIRSLCNMDDDEVLIGYSFICFGSVVQFSVILLYGIWTEWVFEVYKS